MDLFYAVTLMVAIAAGTLSLLMNALALFRSDVRRSSTARIWMVLLSHRVAAGALVVGALSLAISIVVHSRWGHGPDTVAPMDLWRLVSEHQAFPAVAAILILDLTLSVFRRSRQEP